MYIFYLVHFSFIQEMKNNNTWDFTTQVREGKVLFGQHHKVQIQLFPALEEWTKIVDLPCSPRESYPSLISTTTWPKTSFTDEYILVQLYIYIYISKSRNPKISRKFLAVSTSSFDGVKFFVLHLIHSVMVNLRCYRATYRHGVIPPPRQDSVQSRHLFQGQTGRGPASAVGMRLAKRDSWWRKKNS